MSNQLQVSGEAKIRAIQGPVVANSGVITALDGDASEYVRGDGTLADFPTSTGGGSSVSYYLNTSVSQGTIGGVAYKQLSKTPISGAGTDVSISANGYIASYITDANDPALLEVPAGNFNCEFYFSVNSNAHNPYVYAEVYKYDGTTFTLLGSNVSIPQYLSNGTTLSPYYFAIAVSTAVLTVTDRIAIRIYVNVDGRTVTLHTENNHLCQVVTTFSKGLISLNNLTRQNQFFGTGTSGTDFAISSATATHTFNLPVASATNTGKLSSTDWSTFNGKVPYTGAIANLDLGLFSISGSTLFLNGTPTTIPGYLYLKKIGNAAYINYAGYGGITAYSNNFTFISDVNGTDMKRAILDLASLTNNTARTFTLPDLSGTLALLEGSQTFTGLKTFSSSPISDGGYSFKILASGTPFQNGYSVISSLAGNVSITQAISAGNLKSFTFDFSSWPTNTFYTYTLPASDGTIALTSDLGAYVTLATTQTISGNKTFSSAVTASFFVSNSGILLSTLGQATSGGNYGAINAGTDYIDFRPAGGGIFFLKFPYSTFRTFTLPDATGTIALTSNLSSYVPYTGATGAVNLGFNLLTTNSINLDGNSVSGVLNIKSNSSITTSGAGYVSLVSGNVNQLSFVFNGGNSATFTSVSLSASRTYSLPDAGGTIALLSGTQTFTGATTFSSDLLVSGLTIGRGGSAVVGNTAIGAGTLAANTTGVFNTALGSSALASNTIGVSNTAIGSNSLLVNTTGNNNTAIGTDSLNVNTTGSKNTAIGYYALVSNTTASNNIAIGYYALSTNSTAAYNLAIGNNSLRNNVGTQNIGIGEEALLSNTIGQSNTAIGFQALQGNTTGGQNFALGIGALANNTTGSGNIAIGASTLASNITTSNSIGIGFNSLLFATGGNNIAIGNESGKSITTGSNNTIIGAYAGTAAMANNIVLADGAGTIRYQWNGTNNAFTGAATFSSSVGIQVAAGGLGGTLDVQGTNNVYNAIFKGGTTTGQSFGPYFRAGTNASDIAFQVKDVNETNTYFRIRGDGNVGIGTGSPSYKLHISGGNGSQLLLDTTSQYCGIDIANTSSVKGGLSWDNTNAIFGLYTNGSLPMTFQTNNTERMRITSGGLFKFQNNGSSYESSTAGVNEFNTAANDTNVVFRNTASSLTAARAGIDVFYSAAAPNSTTACFYQAADNAAGRTLRFSVRSNGGIENYATNNIPLSDERLKKDIIPLESVWDKIKNIEIVKYKFKDQTHEDFNMGVIAQQVQKVAPELVDDEGWGTFAEDGTTYKGIWETDLNYYSIKALQEAMAKIESLQEQINELKNK